MTDAKPKPLQYVTKMIEAAQSSKVDDMPAVGAYAIEYGDRIKADLNAENVQAFLYGAAVVNLLLQEAILRTSMIANEAIEEASNRAEFVYSSGLGDGAQSVAGFIARAIEQVMDNCTEGPAYDRAFQGIVNQF